MIFVVLHENKFIYNNYSNQNGRYNQKKFTCWFLVRRGSICSRKKFVNDDVLKYTRRTNSQNFQQNKKIKRIDCATCWSHMERSYSFLFIFFIVKTKSRY